MTAVIEIKEPETITSLPVINLAEFDNPLTRDDAHEHLALIAREIRANA